MQPNDEDAMEKVVIHKSKEENGTSNSLHLQDIYRNRETGGLEIGSLNGEMFLQALNGFIIILTCEGEVFFATHTIESYLGFHQSDIVHQSVYELVHSEDREELQRQLLWNTFLPNDLPGLQLAEALAPDKSSLFERSFTVRFRCLLDNTSGFLRLDIRGRVKVLHGQNRKAEDVPLALFAYCTPFGPPSLLEIPQKENMFKSKHKLDFSLVSMDQKGKTILGYSDLELANMGGYDLVHFDDLAYVASAHQELLKTGASGMIAYRYQKKSEQWQWLQTSSRLVYKNSKPDFVICTHKQLMEEEGRDLLGKRTMDFKVSYLDTGLASTYFTDADQLINTTSESPSTSPVSSQQRYSRRYKTQLRDFLSTCRSKRKLLHQPSGGQVSPVHVDYINDPAGAVAAAYSNLNPIYSSATYVSTENVYMTPPAHSSSFYSVSDNLFHQYRLQGGYYSEYPSTSTPFIANGFITYDSYSNINKEDKWAENGKCISMNGSIDRDSNIQTVYDRIGVNKCTKQSPPLAETPDSNLTSSPISAANTDILRSSQNKPRCTNGSTNNISDETMTTKHESNDVPTVDPKEESPFEPRRQTVLMWGMSHTTNQANNKEN
ncbi:aryl hydrocarbon receptor protein 1 isoform X2 [Malaya genurostris]|uniref:aryl hydrocarbon receptor protein 1 isoform X2 n=1 Tax=Malaya genurostris TaxID=325434 RepID=UPI0026F3937D|nr:aryl hydrocarbon receptor protein 1 isoform X2 [Malaya genurostris]